MIQRKTRTIIAILVSGALVACGGSGSGDSEDSETGTGSDIAPDDGAGSDIVLDDDTGSDVVPDDGTGSDVVPEDGTGSDVVPDAGTGSDTVSGTFSQLGALSVSDMAGGQLISINAFFVSVANSFNANTIQSAYTDSLDSCDVTQLDFLNIPDSIEIEDLLDQVGEMTMLSAGDVITISSPAGSYAELGKDVFENFISYHSEDELTGPLPSGLVADIPGDDFPAFANVQVPDVESIALTLPADGQAVSADTVFTWSAGNNPNATVSLSSSQFTVGSSTMTSVNCQVKDDGSFTFPAATAAELGGSFSGIGATISRSVISFQQQGNAMLVVTRDSSQ